MMKQKTKQAETYTPSGYVSPELYVLQVGIEKGYELSFGTGDDSGGSVTGSDYSWADEIDL